MNKTLAIQIAGLGKQYRIGALQARERTLAETLSDSISRPWQVVRSIARRENPIHAGQQTFWALKDVTFDVERGEVIGIIGRNGAGKSTLLKILTRITNPTEGTVRLRGRVGSLLEVGTGFHPELTGRENTYLNGAILGMSREEVDRKFDEIVAFSGVEKFIDTPVKHYSSGMYLRLAFAVAAHLEPDILLVDEVLAVGDAEFQKKCLGKMSDVASEGRTVLFVSHNMAAVEHLCSRAVLLEEGRVMLDDTDVAKVITQYLHGSGAPDQEGANLAYHVNREVLAAQDRADIRITDVSLHTVDGEPLRLLRTGDSFMLRIAYEADPEIVVPSFVVRFKAILGQEIFRLSTVPISGYIIPRLGPRGCVELTVESLPVTGGQYYMDVRLVAQRVERLVQLDDVITLEVTEKDVYGSGMALKSSRGMIVVQHHWTHRVTEHAG